MNRTHLMPHLTTTIDRSPSTYLLAYGSAFLSVGLATLIPTFLALPGSQVNFVLFLTAVAFSAWYGGLAPGLLATLLSVLVATYFFLPPGFSLQIHDPLARSTLLVFILAALFINALTYARARADTLTAAERARLQVTLASIGDAVIVTDTHSRITFMNPVAQSLTGWTQREASGKDLASVFNVVDEYTRKPADNLVATVLRENTVVRPAPSHSTFLLSKDRTPTPIEISGAPLNTQPISDFGFSILANPRATRHHPSPSDPPPKSQSTPTYQNPKSKIQNPIGVVLVFRDITERRHRDTEQQKLLAQLEQQRSTLETIVEGTPIGLALVDRDMRIIDLNVEWARMTGIDIATARGRVLYDINPGFEQRRPYYDRVIAGESIDLHNIPYGPPHLGPHYRDINLRPVHDPAGAITGMLNAVVDVTSRHLLDKQKDEFIAVASHELKTPITTIKGYTQLSLRVARKLGEESLIRALTAVDERANRLTRLVNDMLDVSRLESGSLPLEMEPFDLTTLVREVVNGTELVNPEFRFELQLPEQQLTVEGDRQRIEQVMTNLVQNAIKYSGTGSNATVSVKRENRRAIVCVRDYGLGIPLSQQADVFKRFFRGSNAGYTNYGGLGLGLYISRGIIERHGGHIWMESEEGKGSAFYFDLPLTQEKEAG